jgi:FMN phosphatase YigB (HAD superfamily)
MKRQSLDKIIFFIDLDNTLIESPYPKIFDEIVRDISTNTGKNSNLIWSLINKEFKTREDKNLISAFDWDGILSMVCKKLGSKWKRSLIADIESYINKFGIKVFDGVENSLKVLRLKSDKLYCTTNGYLLYQEPFLEASGLLSIFDDFITPDFLGVTKASKNFYCRKLEENSKAIVVGDSYKYDILYPTKFGFYTIWDVETVLPRSIIERYLSLAPTQRPTAMNDELMSYLKAHENTIYLQSPKLTELPDAIIFNFPEIISFFLNIIGG